jgi:hypothetical protein
LDRLPLRSSVIGCDHLTRSAAPISSCLTLSLRTLYKFFMTSCRNLNAEGNLMFLHFLVKFLEAIFYVGLAGSMVVAVWAFVGDIHVFLDKDEEPVRSSTPS